jgi:hypothetical protein
MGEHAKSWAQGANAWCQIRVNLFKKDGPRVQISRVGRKLIYEINTMSAKAKSLTTLVKDYIFKGYWLGRMPVFIKQGELYQYILKVHFQAVPVNMHIGVKVFFGNMPSGI